MKKKLITINLKLSKIGLSKFMAITSFRILLTPQQLIQLKLGNNIITISEKTLYKLKNANDKRGYKIFETNV